MLLDELIERFDAGAVVTASPVMLDSGRTYRWVLEIDGEPVPDVYAQERPIAGSRTRRALLMVRDDDVVEISRWSVKSHPDGPAQVVETLGSLRRRQSR